MLSMSFKLTSAKPFLKWAGGKTQLLPEIQALLARAFAENYAWTYIEPFVGGGAVLFHVLENFPCLDRAMINDINPDLIAVYRTLKDNLEPLMTNLSQIEQAYDGCADRAAKKRFYLRKRDQFNRLKCESKGSAVNCDRTALFIFLNKTCFNGLYRVNRKGEFNVPFGERKSPKIYDRENLLRGRDRLQNVDIELGDFETTLKYAARAKNVLYYLDPPYKPLNATSSFTAYTREDFSDRDQIRVKEFCDRIHQSGGYFILSNSDAIDPRQQRSFFDDLYAAYTIKRVKAKRYINCKADGRGSISELLITNLPKI